MRPLRPASHHGAKFLDETAAACRSLGRIAKFEAEFSDGTEIRGGIALVQMIEQSGTNIVHGMDINPYFAVGQTINASPRLSVLPYRERRKGITALSFKRHLGLLHSEVAPGRLLLGFHLYSGPAAECFAVSGALGNGEGSGIGVGANIGGSQFVLAFPPSFQVGGQLTSGKRWAFLNANAAIAEHCHV